MSEISEIQCCLSSAWKTLATQPLSGRLDCALYIADAPTLPEMAPHALLDAKSTQSIAGRMLPSCPPIQPTILIADDPFLAARLSCALSQSKNYLAVLGGPRPTRPDHGSEVTRRNKATACAQAHRTLLAGLPEEGSTAMMAALPHGHAEVVADEDVAALIIDQKVRGNPPLKWARRRSA